MIFKLKEVVTVTMGQSPKSESYNSDGNGIPFLQGNRTFGKKYPQFDTYTTSATKIAQPGEVIMSVRAPVGELNVTPIEMCLGRGLCSLKMKNGNQEFLYYLMKYYVRHLINRESGTIFGSVNKNDINSLEIDIPTERSIQDAIARILSSIDEKIELNEKINDNLPPQLCKAQHAAIAARQTPKTDESWLSGGKVANRGGNEETAEQFSSQLAA